MNDRRSRSVAELLGAAAEWRLLSLLLARPTAPRKREATRLSRELPVEEVRRAVRAWGAAAEEGAYLRLLGPGGLVASRAVAYRPFADPGWLLADIGRHHQAFGYRPTTEEPPDHVAVLADFVGYLLLKEAYARECGDRPAAELTRRARWRFVEEFLVPMAAPLAERLADCGAADWGAAARLIADQIPAPSPAVVPPGGDPPTCGGSCAMA